MLRTQALIQRQIEMQANFHQLTTEQNRVSESTMKKLLVLIALLVMPSFASAQAVFAPRMNYDPFNPQFWAELNMTCPDWEMIDLLAILSNPEKTFSEESWNWFLSEPLAVLNLYIYSSPGEKYNPKRFWRDFVVVCGVAPLELAKLDKKIKDYRERKARAQEERGIEDSIAYLQYTQGISRKEAEKRARAFRKSQPRKVEWWDNLPD